MKKLNTETQIFLQNVDRGKKAVIGFTNDKSAIEKYVEHTEILATLESILKAPLHTIWDAEGGCLIELSENQIITLYLEYGNRLRAMREANHLNPTKTLEFEIMGSLNEIF